MPRFVFAVCVFAALTVASVAQEPKDKHPLAGLEHGTQLHVPYQHQAMKFSDDVKGHRLWITRSGGDDGVTIVIDPTPWEVNLFGDTTPKAPPPNGPFNHNIEAKLKPFLMPDPLNQGRRVFAIESKVLGDKLFLVVPGKKGQPYKLVARDKDGKIESAITLEMIQEPAKFPPCHPGCFPAGTMVATPDGLKKIETIKPGDKVLTVPEKGKPTPLKVASVFSGKSDLVEIDTEAGKFVTTPKQPLLLADGGTRSAGSLVKGDAIMRWQEGKAVAVKVNGVKPLQDPAQIYNLVLEERGTFIANGFLVKSKPPPK